MLFKGIKMKRISLIKTIGTVGVLGTSSIVLATNLTSCSKIETITIDFGELISIESDDHFGFISFAKFESHDYRTIITTEDDKKPNGIHSDDYLFSTAQKLYLMCNSSSKGDVATLMFIDSIPPVEGKQTIVA
jgi:hypothetical protein